MDPEPLRGRLADPTFDDVRQFLGEPGDLALFVALSGHRQRRVVEQPVATVRTQLGAARQECGARLHRERGGHGGGGRLAVEEVYEDAVALLHVLIDEERYAPVVAQQPQHLGERAPLVDDRVPSPGPELAEPPIELGVVERPGHHSDGAEALAVRQPVQLPVAHVRRDQHGAPPPGKRALDVLGADDFIDEGGHFARRPVRHPQDVEKHGAEVSVHGVGHLPSSFVGPVREGVAQVLDRDGNVAAIQGAQAAAERAPQSERGPAGQDGHEPGDGRGRHGLETMAPRAVHAAGTRRATATSLSRSSASF
jgi:hypothetical protein